MAPPITMVVATVMGITLGYSGRRWWLSGIVTGTLLTLYSMSGGSEDFVLTGVMVALFFPLFFSIGSLASMVGRFFKGWNVKRSRIEPRNP